MDTRLPGCVFFLLGGPTVSPNKVTRLLVCSGQVYYQLVKARKANNIGDLAICRVEQISPFPYDGLHSEISRFPNAHVVWVQEEPQNAGAWSYVSPRISSLLRQWTNRKAALSEVTYVGRAPAASTATGTKRASRRRRGREGGAPRAHAS